MTRTHYFWLIALSGFVVFILLFEKILLPFVIGIGLAYLLDPLTTWLTGKHFPRWGATIISLSIAIITFVFLIILIVPLIQQQFIDLMDWLPKTLTHFKTQLAPYFDKLEYYLGIESGDSLKGVATEQASQAVKWVGQFLGDILSSGVAFANLIALLFVTPVVAFFQLRDFPLFVSKIKSWLPRDHADTIQKLMREMDATLAAFIRGQLIVCVILATYYGLGLSLVGLNFGFAIGVITGFLSFIPYVGSIFGFVCSVGLAFAQFTEWSSILAVAIVFGAGQFVEGNFLSPVLVGNRVKLHPVWIIFALFAMANLFGFLGAVIAIPVASVLGVLVRFLMGQYLKSPFYVSQSKKMKHAPTPDPL